MKTTELKKFTKKAKKIYSNKEPLFVCTKVFIKDDQMIFTDLNHFIIYTCDFTMRSGFIDLPFLHKIVSKVKSENIDIVPGEKENQVLIKTDSSSFQCIENIQPEDYPSLPELKNQITENLSYKDVSRIKKSSAYSSSDELKPVLNTVLIDPGYIVATDTQKRAFHTREDPGKNQFILNTKTVELLDEGQSYEIQKGDHIYLVNENMTIVQQGDFSDRTFPNWQSIIREKSDIVVYGLQVKPFIEALQESDIATNQGTHKVLLHIDPVRKIVNIRSKDTDFVVGYNCNLEVDKIQGDSLTVGINSTFMLSILKNEGFEKVNLFFEDDNYTMYINNDLLLALTDTSGIEDLEPTQQELDQPV